MLLDKLFGVNWCARATQLPHWSGPRVLYFDNNTYKIIHDNKSALIFVQ